MCLLTPLKYRVLGPEGEEEEEEVEGGREEVIGRETMNANMEFFFFWRMREEIWMTSPNWEAMS